MDNDAASLIANIGRLRGEFTQGLNDLRRQVQTLQGFTGLTEPLSLISGFNETTPSTSPPTATQVGMGQILLAGAGLTFTKPSNSPFLRLALSGAFANYDYVVDSNGSGTHTTLFGTTGALEVAIATGVSKTIWVCTTHTETRTAEHLMSAYANGQVITVESGGHYRPKITANFTGNVIGQTAANAGTGARLVFKGLEFDVNTGGQTCSFYQPRSGIASTIFELQDVNFSGAGTWSYAFDMLGAGSTTASGFFMRNCRGTLTALGRLSTGGAATGAFILETSELTLTNLFVRTNNTDYEAGNAYIINDNNLTLSGYGLKLTYVIPLTVSANNITHTSATDLFTLGTAGSSVVEDITITGNNYSGGTAGCSFVDFTPATLTMTNVNITGNALKGPGSGTAINAGAGVWTITTSAIWNSYRNWTTTVAANIAISGTGMDHHTLTNFAQDDHTQYLLANGTRALTGNWNPGAFTIGNYDYTSKALKAYVADANYFFDIAGTGASQIAGKQTVGGTQFDWGDSTKVYLSKITVLAGDYTKITWYGKVNITPRNCTAYLYTDSAGSPGTLVATTNTGALPTGAANTDFTFATTQTLSAGTYWVGISNSGGGFTFSIFYDVGAAGDSYDGGTAAASPMSGGALGTRDYTAFLTGTAPKQPLINFTSGNSQLIYNRSTEQLQLWPLGVQSQLESSTQNAWIGYQSTGTLTAPTSPLAGDMFFGGASKQTGFRNAAARAAQIVYTWPSTDPTAGQMLSASAPVSGVSTLTWVGAGSAGTGAGVYSTTTGILPIDWSDVNIVASAARISFFDTDVDDPGLVEKFGNIARVHLEVYALLSGREDGQVLYGGINDGDSLVLRSNTSDFGPGMIYFGDPDDEVFVFDEDSGYFGIGITPGYPLHVIGNSKFNGWQWLSTGADAAPAIASAGDMVVANREMVASWLKVGSTTVLPLNTTTGDMTATRLVLGNADTAFPNANSALLIRSNLVSVNLAVIDLSITKTGSANLVPLQGLAIVVDSETTTGANSSPTAIYGQAIHGGSTSANIVAAFSANATVNINAGAIAAMVGYEILSGALVTPAAGGGTITLLAGFRVNAPSYGGLAVTTASGIKIANMGNASVVNAVAVDIAKQINATTINLGIRNAGGLSFTPSAQQSIAVTAPIVVDATVVQVSTTTAANMTATPTVADGVDGQVVIIVNTGANTFTLQDQGTLAASNLRLSVAGLALATRDSVMLMYSTSTGDWIELNNSNVI